MKVDHFPSRAEVEARKRSPDKEYRYHASSQIRTATESQFQPSLALMRNLITALLREEKIQTTDPKAKELRRLVEPVITLGKRGDLHARRQAASILFAKTVLQKLSIPWTAFQGSPRAVTPELSSWGASWRCRPVVIDRAGR